MDISKIINDAVSTRIDELIKQITDDVIEAIVTEQTNAIISDAVSPLATLLNGDSLSAELQLKQRGVTLDKVSSLLIARPIDPSIRAQDMLCDIADLLDTSKRFYLCDMIDGYLVVVTAFDQSSMDLGEEIKFYLQDSTTIANLFVHAGCRDFGELQHIFRDYYSHASAIQQIYSGRKLLTIHDLILAKEVMALARDEKCNDHIRWIIDALKDDSDELLETLAIYLIDCDAQLNKAASTLYLHRNTVSYRLNKIKQLSGTDFTKMPAAYDYYSAAALWRVIS